MKKEFVVFIISSVLAMSIAAAAAQRIEPQAEEELVELLNQERARHGLASLQVDERLREAARAHSELMARKHLLSHQLGGEPVLSKRLGETGLRFDNDAENVAYDSAVQGAHIGLMHSPPHRANILSPEYNAVGVGVVRSGDLYWVTQDFARRLQEYSEKEAESAIVEAWEQERRQAHERHVAVVGMPELRRMACAMGKQGKLDSRSPMRLKSVQSVVAFTTADPGQLPSSVTKKARDRDVRRVGIGACFAESDKFPGGVWWAVFVFY